MGRQRKRRMQNGYFQVVRTPGGYGLQIFQPKDGGEDVRLQEVMDYLDRQSIPYDSMSIKKAILAEEDAVCFLERKDCPEIEESCRIEVSEDNLQAIVRFYPASQTGKRATMDSVIKDLRFRNIVYGIQMSVLQDHFMSDGIYCTDLVVARGKEPRHGTDAYIKYYFNTDVHAQPTLKDDGTVDYFHLNMINPCKKGQLLAEVIPEDEGEYGTTVQGAKIRPRQVKKAHLEFGHNIEISEDRRRLASLVDGHVSLVEGKVFVSDVYEVENVDLSTGNIDFEGSVQVNGNVSSNFVIRAGGNVIISGVVEGAYIEAGGNIIIARGMNGMAKGTLKAGGNIVAKFLENATASAGGYVSTESILHSNVIAATEIQVTGKRGFITGGHVRAGQKIEVKTLGAMLGAPTVVEVGVDPEKKAEYMKMQKEVSEIVKNIRSLQPILANFAEKKSKGVRFTPDQINYLRNTAASMETLNKSLEEKNRRMQELQLEFNPQERAMVQVRGEVYPGTTIIIGDSSMQVKSTYHYCRFERIDGDVKSTPL